MLLKFLQLLGAKWTKFMADSLDVDLSYLRDFIHKDIIETFPSRLFRWSKHDTANKRQLSQEAKIRNWSSFKKSMTRDEIVPTLLENFRTHFELLTVKVDIIQCLEKSGVLIENDEVSEGLLPRNCEILAHALTYIPISQLKTAMSKAHSCDLFELTENDYVKKFLEDNNFPDGECLY